MSTEAILMLILCVVAAIIIAMAYLAGQVIIIAVEAVIEWIQYRHKKRAGRKAD